MAQPGVRLFVSDDLAAGAAATLRAPQAHYLRNVMRLSCGDPLRLFNGRDGEWAGRLETLDRGRASVRLEERTRLQTTVPDLWLVFAPVKRGRIDFIAQKATELGVSGLVPMMTRHTVATRVNTERLTANAVEAAEQCGRLDVPRVFAPQALDALLAAWPPGRRLLFCDETGAPPIAGVLSTVLGGEAPWAVMIGPEGGFAAAELDALRKLPFASAVGLGPRVLRADTAALAALACWQALAGDWRVVD